MIVTLLLVHFFFFNFFLHISLFFFFPFSSFFLQLKFCTRGKIYYTKSMYIVTHTSQNMYVHTHTLIIYI